MDGTMQPLHLFLTESMLLLFLEKSSLVFSKGPSRDERHLQLGSVEGGSSPAHQELCLLALLLASAVYILHSPRESHFASLMHCFRARASAALGVRESPV